jgi:predicted O-methyltransferase YrrM
MTDFSGVLDAIDGVEGWLTADQARLLYERAAELAPQKRIVEIGSYHGRSTIVLALAAPEAEVVAIDPYVDQGSGPDLGERSLEKFDANLRCAGVRHRVTQVRSFSTGALEDVPGPIDLLYVDGAHDFRAAVGDVRAWGSRVRDGGTMFVHDAFSSVGVTIAQMVVLAFGNDFRYIGRSRSLAEYRREHVTAGAWAHNALAHVAQLPWFLRNVAVKVALRANSRGVARALGHDSDVFPY